MSKNANASARKEKDKMKEINPEPLPLGEPTIVDVRRAEAAAWPALCALRTAKEIAIVDDVIPALVGEFAALPVFGVTPPLADALAAVNDTADKPPTSPPITEMEMEIPVVVVSVDDNGDTIVSTPDIKKSQPTKVRRATLGQVKFQVGCNAVLTDFFSRIEVRHAPRAGRVTGARDRAGIVAECDTVIAQHKALRTYNPGWLTLAIHAGIIAPLEAVRNFVVEMSAIAEVEEMKGSAGRSESYIFTIDDLRRMVM